MDWKNNIMAPVVVAALVSGVIYFSDVASKAPELVIPTGAVVSFNLTKCPRGWSEYKAGQGRVVIGYGEGKGLTSKALGQIGGAETHTLLEEEMPSHNHQTWFYNQVFQVGGSTGALSKDNGGKPLHVTSSGDGKPHNNMQPWVALLYCERQ